MFPGEVDPIGLVEVKEPYVNRPRGKLPLGWAWLGLLLFLYRMGDVLGRVLSLAESSPHLFISSSRRRMPSDLPISW